MGMEIDGGFPWGSAAIKEINNETADIIEDVIKSEFKALPAEKIQATAAKCRKTECFRNRTPELIETERKFRADCGTAMEVFKEMVFKVAKAPGYLMRMGSVILLLPVIDDMLTEETAREDSEG